MKVASPASAMTSRRFCSLFLSCTSRRRTAPSFLTSASQRLCQYVARCASSSGTDDTRNVSATASNGTQLSSLRGRKAVDLLPTYLADARAVELYSPSNPNGALQLGVAESLMLEDWLVPALNNITPSYQADAIYYQPTAGRDDLKASMARYIEDLCGLVRGRLQTDGLIVGAGCNAVLENLCIALADVGDTVLIPSPYYAAFEFDLGARAGLVIQSVTTEAYHPECQTYVTEGGRIDPRIYYPNAASLDAAFQRTVDETGTAPKILLLSHPMNPLGIFYPIETVKECIDWCRSKKVHLVGDEIYAGSVYRNQAKFASILKLATTTPSHTQSNSLGLGPYVHWIYALSKDFALSGLRVGVAYTENTEVMTPLQKLNDLCQVSSQTQLWTKSMLEATIDRDTDDLWISAFRRDNHERLNHRSSAVTSILDKYRIPYLTPDSGLFVWIDFSQFLHIPFDGNMTSAASVQAQQERTLYLELVQQYGLLLTPGSSMRNERPGFFRCVFTAATDSEFMVALQRIEAFLISKGDSIQ